MSQFNKQTQIMIELGFREEALPQLKAFLDLLWAANDELNLVSRKMTFEDLIDNHVIDCLLPLKKFPQNIKTVADFGTGGGLPGIIYAIQFPQIGFHLFEKSKKKQDFLNRCSAIAPNIEVKGEIPPELGKVDLVVARAFKPLDVLLDVSRSHFNRGGKYFLLKARKEKINEELAQAQKKFKDLKATIEPLKSPVLDVERHLLLI
ncbi:MAG: 16S rRNA (guanine(527)-N(7))-methyltransferase RsmG [Oligoflexia bacterium]|nr:16S rRNA (guanine(527)-N(7))-methyltransferase RsmG [Oligoflexia bacterium]